MVLGVDEDDGSVRVLIPFLAIVAIERAAVKCLVSSEKSETRCETPTICLPSLVGVEGRLKSDLDGRTDIYSLGAVAFAPLTGRAPFDGTNPMDAIIAHARDEVVWPPEHEPNSASCRIARADTIRAWRQPCAWT
jgi:serine/threonine protein kinase